MTAKKTISCFTLLSAMVLNGSVAFAGDSVYNILDDYSSDGTDTIDDTQAIQDAIDAAYNADGGVVYIPQGKYYIDTTLELKDGVTLQGIGVGSDGVAGASGSVIYVQGMICGINVSGDRCKIDGLRVLGTYNVATGTPIIDYVSPVLPTTLIFVNANRFEGGTIAVESSEGTGLYFFEGNLSSFQSIYAVHNSSHGVYIKGDDPTDANACWFGLIDSRNNRADGILVENCFNNAFGQLTAQGNDWNGVHIDCDWHSILNIYSEGNDGADLRFSSNAHYNTVFQLFLDDGTGTFVDYGGSNSIYGANSGVPTLAIGRPVFCPYDLDNKFGGSLELSKGSDGHYYFEQVASGGHRKLILDGGTGGLYLSAEKLYSDEINLDDKRVRYASAAPTSGAWVQGEIVFNSSPSAGGDVGWVCTASGSPGVWKTFGVIAN